MQPPRLYWHLSGKHSLMEADPAWAGVHQPDATGYYGLVSSAPTGAFREERCFSEAGFHCRVVDYQGTRYEARDSDIVCFESGPADEFGSHRVIITTTDERGCWPPNTLFRVVEVHEQRQRHEASSRWFDDEEDLEQALTDSERSKW